MKLLTRLFPRNGIGSEYQRSIIEDLRPFQRGSFNLNAFISKPARGLLSLVRDKHVQDGELKVNLLNSLDVVQYRLLVVFLAPVNVGA